MRRTLFLSIVFAVAAPAFGACPTMVGGTNVFIQYIGASSGCSPFGGNCRAGEPIEFSAASFGYDFSCSTHVFAWNFGDGTTATGQSVNHTYAAAATYTVRLTISNNVQTVVLEQAIPVVSTSPPSPPAACGTMIPGINVFLAYHNASFTCTQLGGNCNFGEPISMSAIGVGYDFGCASHTFSWVFGDSTGAAGQNVTHTYRNSGTYPVFLTISHPGVQTVTLTQTITIPFDAFPPTPTPPTPTRPCNIIITPSNLPGGSVGSPYAQRLAPSGGVPPYSIFLVSGSLPPGLQFGNSSVSGTPTTSGVFSFAMHVVDSSGCGAVVSYTILVSGACPLMVADGNVIFTYRGGSSSCSELGSSCAEGEVIAFNAMALGYSFGCAVHALAWNFGDGQFAAGESVTHAFEQPGVYTVTLTIANPQQSVQLTKVVMIKAVRRRAVPR